MAKKRKQEPQAQTWVWPAATTIPPKSYDPETDTALYPSRGKLSTREERDIQNSPRPKDSGVGRGNLATGTDRVVRPEDHLPLKLHSRDKDVKGKPCMTNDFLRYISAGFNESKREATMRQFLHVREVAEVLATVGINEAGVRDLLRSKELHGNQAMQDGRWRIPLLSLKRYLTDNGTFLPEQIDAIMAHAEELIQTAKTDETTKTANTAQTAI